VKLTYIEGPALSLYCDGCKTYGVGGTVPYVAASSEDIKQPEEWYTDGNAFYCAVCAVKLKEEDPTRSVSQFYANTSGTEVLPENL
jgi:hypothetical protein